MAEPKAHQVEPPALLLGQSTEVTIRGDRLREGGKPARVWSSPPAKWELVEHKDEKKKPDPRVLRFRVTPAPDAKPGVLSLRLYTDKGVSPPYLMLADTSPGTVGFRFHGDKPFTHAFAAKAGKTYACEVWANRINRDVDPVMTVHSPQGRQLAMADDSDLHGADPSLLFTAPADGNYTIRVHDLRWRGGPQACLRVAERPLLSPKLPEGHAKTAAEPEPIPVQVKAGSFLTVTPLTRAIGSTASLKLELKDEKGRRLAHSGDGDLADEPLRRRIDRNATCRIFARDLLGRAGLPFALEISEDVAPFLVRQETPDRHKPAPGGTELKFKFRVTRFGYDGPIKLLCPDLKLEKDLIPEKKNDAEIVAKAPDHPSPGSLLAFRFRAEATHGGKTYSCPVSTTPLLDKTPAHLPRWPEELDGWNYLVVTAKPPEKK